MTARLVTLCFLTAMFILPVSATGTSVLHMQTDNNWDTRKTAAALAGWATDFILADLPDIVTRVLSTSDTGCYLEAGTVDGVNAGQVFEIYRVWHDGAPDEIAGQVQVAWTREDYSFCEPRGNLDLSEVTSFNFARIVHLPPVLALISDTSEGGGGPELDRLLQLTSSLIGQASVRTILGEPDENSWRLILTPDLFGLSLRASLINPGGETAAGIMLDPQSGTRISGAARLDPSYLSGNATPYEHNLAPPGRRAVRIASGNIYPGAGDELAVLAGSDLWIYDLSGPEARLLSTLSLTIPPGPVRHREDAGSLELIDLNDDGLMEVCVAPGGAIRGELWQLEGDEWAVLEYLPHPAHAVAASDGAVLVAPWLLTSPALNPRAMSWFYPLSERESESLTFNFSPTGIAVLPTIDRSNPVLLATDSNGSLYRIPIGEPIRQLPGEWGSCIKTGMGQNRPIALVTGPGLLSDSLKIINPIDGQIYGEFPLAAGVIIDIALGDIDRDNLAEIIVATLESEGVRIYF